MMKFDAALLILFILSAPAAASCSCGSGASAGFNFLGDPSFNIDMMSFDEFSKASYVANKMEEPVSEDIGGIGGANRAGQKEDINNISIDLDDGSHFDLVLFPAGEDLFGRGEGDMAPGSAGASEALGVVGVRDGDRLILEMVSLSGNLYRVDLQGEESAFLGDYIKIATSGKIIQGTARGILHKKVVVIG